MSNTATMKTLVPQESMLPADRWKYSLGSFAYDFARLETYVMLWCSSFVGFDLAKNLTFGKRLDHIKKHAPLHFAERANDLLKVLEEARSISNFRNTILHNPIFYWVGMHIPEHGHPGEIWALKSNRTIQIEEVEVKLDALGMLLRSCREQDRLLDMHKIKQQLEP